MSRLDPATATVRYMTNQRGRLGRWLRLLFQSRRERERAQRRRLRDLDARITETPASFTHLALRGELHLERGECESAAADFEAALELITGLDDASGWRVVEQVMRDRALYGSKEAARRLPDSGGQRRFAILEA